MNIRYLAIILITALNLLHFYDCELSIPDTKCLSEFLPVKTLSNRNGEFEFCKEHEKRTCCPKNTVKELLVESFRFRNSDVISDKCRHYSNEALCAVCDGDVGTGFSWFRNSPVLCLDFCNRWFESCKNSWFTLVSTTKSQSTLIPCNEGSFICSELVDIVKDANEFCLLSGFETNYSVKEAKYQSASNSSFVNLFVFNESIDAGLEAEACFDGTPSAKKKGAIKKTYKLKNKKDIKYNKFNDFFRFLRSFRLINFIFRIFQINPGAVLFVIILSLWLMSSTIKYIVYLVSKNGCIKEFNESRKEMIRNKRIELLNSMKIGEK